MKQRSTDQSQMMELVPTPASQTIRYARRRLATNRIAPKSGIYYQARKGGMAVTNGTK